MNESNQATAVVSIIPEELKDRIDGDEDVFLLDVRSESDFDEWHIEGRNINGVNYPYFQLLDGIPDDLLEKLPENQPITVLCAKGVPVRWSPSTSKWRDTTSITLNAG